MMHFFFATLPLHVAFLLEILFFITCLVTALVSFICGIVLAFSRRPNKWVEASLVGCGIPIVSLGLALAEFMAKFRH